MLCAIEGRAACQRTLRTRAWPTASSTRGTLCDFLAAGDGARFVMDPSDMLCCGAGKAAARPYLAVSERGIGLAVVGRRRVKIYDFEADEDDDEDDDEAGD